MTPRKQTSSRYKSQQTAGAAGVEGARSEPVTAPDRTRMGAGERTDSGPPTLCPTSGPLAGADPRHRLPSVFPLL
ncbi:hypothetical protein TREES_T100014266 [Tupaia chinensis]|uniref:Uncharacterized protein n=1 Tax=Tupaia chinensis TaxID=246437 RepID=L9JE86_TUPCH|nr:hypothetical protein TREES_T100014266 [Tupaia chinensis]